MQIELYTNTHNTNSLTRTFVNTRTLNGVLKEGSDMLSPTVLIESEDNPTGFNMMHIPAFDRYYFVHFKNVRATLWEVIADEVDVLFSNRNRLLNLTCIIDKQEKNYNNYIDDGSYVAQVDTFPEVIKFNGGFNETGEFVLITTGGT